MEIRDLIAKMSAALLRQREVTQLTRVGTIAASPADRPITNFAKLRQIPAHRPRRPLQPASNM
jgi:hypothetical protein